MQKYPKCRIEKDVVVCALLCFDTLLRYETCFSVKAVCQLHDEWWAKRVKTTSELKYWCDDMKFYYTNKGM